MKWPRIQEMVQGLPIPEGYDISYIGGSEVEEIIAKIKAWYPDVSTGAESCHLDPTFYKTQVNLRDSETQRDIIVLVVKFKGELVAIYSAQINHGANWFGGRLTVIAPDHRHKNLGYICVLLFERIGKLIGAGMLWVTATLQHPFTQSLMEKCGFQLSALIPAWDRDFIDGKPKYVSEALYVKVLAAESEVQSIDDTNLSPNVKQLKQYLKNLNHDQSG